MDGAHDLGGRAGFGPVVAEPSEPVFHEPWEAKVFGVTASAFGHWRSGEFRHAIERMDPEHYLGSSYFDHWLSAVETLSVEHGLLGAEELRARGGGSPHRHNPVAADAVPPPRVVADGAEPRFRGGDPEI